VQLLDRGFTLFPNQLAAVQQRPEAYRLLVHCLLLGDTVRALAAARPRAWGR